MTQHICPGMLWIFSAFIILLANCSSLPWEEPLETIKTSQIFHSNFDETWKAVLISVSAYPLSQSDQDAGLIQTELVNHQQVNKSPLPSQTPPEAQYFLKIFVRKEKNQRRPKTFVQIQKKIQIQKTFFSEPQTLMSDGLEEQILLYRIYRTLTLEKIINQASKK